MRSSLALLPFLFAAAALSAQTVMQLPRPEPTAPRLAPSRAADWTVQRASTAIEMLPQLRVSMAGAGQPGRSRALSVRQASALEPDLGRGQFGVAFNHGMQAYGALSGEISYRLDDPSADGVSIARTWGLLEAQRLGNSRYWVARAQSPQQLRDALRGLQQMPGISEAEWVIVYGLERGPIDAQLTGQR